MNTPNPNPNPKLLALKKSAQNLPTLRTKRKIPHHGSGEKFLKGPIPLDWLARAGQLPGKSLHVALVIWYLAGLNKSATVKLSQAVLNGFEVDLHSKARALAWLEDAELISVQRAPGCSPMITLLSAAKAEANTP
jgi:hypothetical protein